MRLARNGGAYVIAGHYTNVGDSTINAHEHINRKHLEIRGCWGSEVGHFLRALRALERYGAEVPWHLIGARTYGLGDINDALADRRGALRDPEGARRPVGVTRRTRILATLGPSSQRSRRSSRR